MKVYRTDPAWLHVAAAEEGQHEVAGAADNPRILTYASAVDLTVTHDEVPWCSTFVNWVMREAGYAQTRSALATSWLRYGMPADSAQLRGAIAVLCRRDAAPDTLTGSQTGNHVGFLLDANARDVVVFGGNQSDRVQVSHFPRDVYRVRNVRWPRACDRATAA